MKKLFTVLIVLSFGFSVIMGSGGCNSTTSSTAVKDTSGTSGSGGPGRMDSSLDSTLTRDSTKLSH